MSQAPASDSVTVEKRPAGLVVHVAAKALEDPVIKDMGRAIDQAAAPGSRVVLDLSQVQFAPSMALGGLVQLANKCRARQQTLKLAALTLPVRQVLVLTRLDRVLELADSVDAALQ